MNWRPKPRGFESPQPCTFIGRNMKNEGSIIVLVVILALLLLLANGTRWFAALVPSSCDYAAIRLAEPEQCKLNALREMRR